MRVQIPLGAQTLSKENKLEMSFNFMAISSGVVFGIFAMLSYGLADFLAKKAVDKYGPLTALKMSLTLGTSAVLAYSLIFVKFPAITINTFIWILLAGITGTFGWLLFYKGLDIGKVSVVAPIASSWGIIPFILAILVLSEKLTVLQIISASSIFVGIVLVSIVWKEFLKVAKKRLYTGASKAIISMIAFGLAAFFTKFSVDEIGPFYSVVFIRIISVVLIFLYTFKIRQEVKFQMKFVWLLFAVGLLDAVGYLSFNFGLLVGPVSIVSAITSAIPLVVVILAYLFLRERLAVNQYFGILLIIAGFVGVSL